MPKARSPRCTVCHGRGCLVGERVTRRGRRVVEIVDACPACTRAAERQWGVAEAMADIQDNRRAAA